MKFIKIFFLLYFIMLSDFNLCFFIFKFEFLTSTSPLLYLFLLLLFLFYFFYKLPFLYSFNVTLFLLHIITNFYYMLLYIPTFFDYLSQEMLFFISLLLYLFNIFYIYRYLQRIESKNVGDATSNIAATLILAMKVGYFSVCVCVCVCVCMCMCVCVCTYMDE